MKRAYWILLALLPVALYAADAGNESILDRNCSMMGQYAIAGSALRTLKNVQGWLELTDRKTQSEVICRQLGDLHGMAEAMQSLILQESEFRTTKGKSTDSDFHGLGFNNYSIHARTICDDASGKLTPKDLATLKTQLGKTKEYLIELRADIIKAAPHIAQQNAHSDK